MEIKYIDRASKKTKTEDVYGKVFLETLYASNPISYVLRTLFARFAFFSRLYGKMQKSSNSKKKITPFIKKFKVDVTEYEEVDWNSFNDFFTRKLKKEARSIDLDPTKAVIPADGRYYIYPKISSFLVKDKKFTLESLLQDEKLAKKYKKGSMVIARLCPVDYHRFHFPCNGKTSSTKCIDGPLFSVNPIALCKKLGILSENKREITTLQSDEFGDVLYIEVGATYVGTIQQVVKPNSYVKKGDEKGYFEFGGSCVILLFEENKIQFEKDLLDHDIEVFTKMGDTLGTALS